MNRRFYCAVGVASGVLLLGGGVAEAGATADEADRNIDPKVTGVLPTDIFTPTGGQYRLAASIGTLVEGAGNWAPGHGQAEIQPNTESLSSKGMSGTETSPGSQVADSAGAGRAEVLPGFGAKVGGKDLLGTLLSGITGNSLLGTLTGGGGPLGQLLGDGPLGALTGGSKASADGGSPPGAVTVNSPITQDPATGGDGIATDWRQARPGDDGPVGVSGTYAADPASGGVVADPARRFPALNQPATHQPDDATAQGTAVREERAPRAGNSRDPLAGGMFGPSGPLGRMEILGTDTLSGLPLVGDLLGGGLSLNTINIPVSDVVNQVGAQDAGNTLPALGNLPAVGNLGRMLLGESTSRPAEAADARSSVTRADQPLAAHDSVVEPTLGHVAEHRAPAHRVIDKAKVTPQLQALLGPDAFGDHELDGIIHRLPSVA